MDIASECCMLGSLQIGIGSSGINVDNGYTQNGASERHCRHPQKMGVESCPEDNKEVRGGWKLQEIMKDLKGEA